ncbi:MAG: YqiJ family protein [Hyphomonadaceae bacterium]
MIFFEPAMTPFTCALGLMLFIAALELIGMMAGMGLSDMLDSILPDIEVDAEFEGPDAPDSIGSGGAIETVLAWLAIGKVPLLVIIVAFLTAYGLTGFIGQSIFHAVTGIYVHAAIAGIAALFVALPLTGKIGHAIARIMPKEETDAVSRDTFIGKVVEIIRGEAKFGQPAEAKFKDYAGTVHYVLVEPDDEATVFSQGDEVLLVRKKGAHFAGIVNTSPALSNK